MAQYHLSKNGRQSGPFTQEQIDQMVRSGMLTGTELYCQEGSPDWKPVSQLPGFVPAISAPAPAKSSNCLIIGLVVGAVALVLVAIIGLLAAIAVPNFLRARKRSQATREISDLRLIDAAIDQYAIEYKKDPGTRLQWADIQTFLPAGSKLATSGGLDILGHPFGPDFIVDRHPVVPAATFQSLSDVAPAGFWSPYK